MLCRKAACLERVIVTMQGRIKEVDHSVGENRLEQYRFVFGPNPVAVIILQVLMQS